MTETLTKEEQIQFSKEIENLKEATNSSLEFYKRSLVLFNGRTIKNFTHYFLDILSRFRLNIEAVEKLMDSFYDDFRLKISINLLLRSICADSLTALYLITFIDENDPTNTSLKNELDIISSEFLRFGNKFIDEEHHLHETYGIQILKSLEEKKDYLPVVSGYKSNIFNWLGFSSILFCNGTLLNS